MLEIIYYDGCSFVERNERKQGTMKASNSNDMTETTVRYALQACVLF
jgi:hypothetical protein